MEALSIKQTAMSKTAIPSVKDKFDARPIPKQKKYLDFVLFEDYNQEIDEVLEQLGVRDELR